MEKWKPNARYWILKLIKNNFGPGDKRVGSPFGGNDLACQAFITKKGKKILFINERNKEIKINLPAETNASLEYAYVNTGENPPDRKRVISSSITIKPFAVIVMQLN